MRNTSVEIGTIAATLFEPDGEPEAVLVVHAATATPAGFYSGFARFLAENRIATVTYDYRGTGRSGSPRAHRHLGMKEWIEQDVPAVTAWAANRHPGLPQLAVGHSLGGHALTLGYGGPDLTAFALVASHVASMGSIPDRVERARVRLLLQVVGPLSAGLLGYVPARRLGLGEDVPAAAIRQWARWSSLPNYLFDDPAMRGAERAATVTQPVLAVGMSDDPWGTPAQVDRLAGYLTGARPERRTWTPAEAGLPRIGHHGFMRRAGRTTLWPDLLTWLQKQL